MALAKRIAASGDENGGYRKSGSVCYVNCIENKPLKQPEHTITLTNAQPTSATRYHDNLTPKRRKYLRYFEERKYITLIASKVSFTNSKRIKTIQIYIKKNEVKIVL